MQAHAQTSMSHAWQNKQADIQYKPADSKQNANKQTASRHTRHKKTTTDTIIHRDIQDTRRQDRHKKTTTDTIIHRDNNRQHKHCNKITFTDALPCVALPCLSLLCLAMLFYTHTYIHA